MKSVTLHHHFPQICYRKFTIESTHKGVWGKLGWALLKKNSLSENKHQADSFPPPYKIVYSRIDLYYAFSRTPTGFEKLFHYFEMRWTDESCKFSIFFAVTLGIFKCVSGREKGNHLEAQTWKTALRSLCVFTSLRINRALNNEMSDDSETPQKKIPELDL